MAKVVVDVTTGRNVIGVKTVGGGARGVTVISGQNRYDAQSGSKPSNIVDVETGLGVGVTKQYVDDHDALEREHSDSEDERILAEAKAYTDDRMPYLIQSYITENKDLLRGDDGAPFDIYKTYPDLNAMQQDWENVPVGKYVMISSNVGDVDNGKLYKRVQFGFEFIVAMASIEGPQGPQGERGDKGDKGDKGDPGTDATVTADSIASALGYTPADVEDVPTKVSDLTNDSGYLTAVTWGDVTGKPSTFPPSSHTHTVSQITDFPTRVSAFQNDAGYLTQHQSLANYYTKGQVDSALGTKANQDDVDALTAAVATKANASDVYTKAAVNSLLTGKADIGAIPTVPTLISAFTNDRGYITAAQVPEVSSNSIIAALGYTPADEADIPEIPSNVSYFTNDAGYLTSHQSLANYYTKAQVDEALGDKADLTDVPTIPTAVSAFTNDVGYLTQHQSLANYYTKSQTQNQISSAVSSASATLQAAIDLKADASSIPTKVSDLTNDAGYITLAQVPDVSSSSIISALGYTPADSASLTASLIYKGSVASFGDLPASGNKTGDVYNVVAADGDIPAGTNYAWNGSSWDALGGSVDLSGYVQTSRTVNGKALTSDITLTYSDVGALASDGNAVSATEFSAAKSVTLSGAVTGTASSKAGWSITTVRRSCLVGQSGSTVTNPWYKFAAFTIANNNDDREITFLVTDTYTNTGNRFGILRAHFRNDGSKVFSAGSSSLEWLVNSGFDVSQFVMCCNNTAGSTVELWTSIPYAFKFRRFSVLSEGGRASTGSNWTLLNASSAGQAASYTAADNVIVSANSGVSGNAASATEFSANKSVTLTGDVTGSASSKAGWSIATTLANSGATAGSYGPSANAEPGYGSTFNVPYVTVDAKGRVTAISTKTVKIPASDNTDTKVSVTELATDSDSHSEKNVLIKSGSLNANGTEVAYWNRGLRIHERKGTTSRTGQIYLALGTGIATGTDNNMRGILRLFSTKANYADINQADITSNITHTFPATGGTVLNTGTTALSNAATSGKKVADLKINGTTTTLYAPPPDVFVKSGSTAASGLVPAPSTTAGTTKYLREDGTWQVPPDNNTTYSNMGGATSSAAGSAGLVPAPAAGQQGRYLRGDGTWQTPTNTSPGSSGSATFATAKGTAPSSNSYHEHISYDNTGNGTGSAYRFALVGRRLTTGNESGAYITAYDPTSGATRDAHIGVYYPSGGTSYVDSTAVENRFSGLLRSNGNIQRKDTGITRGTAPSANRFVYFQHLDNSNTVMSEVRMGYTTGKTHQISLRVSNDSGTWYDGLIIACDAAGTAPVVTSVTPAQTDDSTKIATTAYVKDCVPKTVGDANTPVYVNANGVVTSTGKSFANYVPTSRKVNGKALSGDITLTASDVGAVSGDQGALAVGSFVIAVYKNRLGQNAQLVDSGSTTAGSNLYPIRGSRGNTAASDPVTDWQTMSNNPLTGTWRNVSGCQLGYSGGSAASSINSFAGIWQRTA